MGVRLILIGERFFQIFKSLEIIGLGVGLWSVEGRRPHYLLLAPPNLNGN